VVVDEAQFEENRKIELKKAAIEGDVNKIAQIGGKMGAQVVIVGTAAGLVGPPTQLAGVEAFAGRADVTARAVRTDTAEVVATEQVGSRKNMRDPQGAANVALTDAATQLGDLLARKIRIEAMKELLRDNLVDAMCDLLPDAEPSVSQWKIKLKIQKK
jgi:hypothetical protein